MSKESIGNLKSAPFALTGSVVRATLGFGSSQRIVHVPVRDAFNLTEADDIRATPKAWCGQCDRRRSREEASSCTSRFCKLQLKPEDAADDACAKVAQAFGRYDSIVIDEAATFTGEPSGQLHVTESEPAEVIQFDWPDAPLPEAEPIWIGLDVAAEPDEVLEVETSPLIETEFETPAAAYQPADRAGGSNGLAAEGSNRPATVQDTKPLNVRPQHTHLPLPFAQRAAQRERAIAFLKARGILVQVVDRAAMIRTYRVTGKQNAMLQEQVIDHAVALGMPEEIGA